MSPRSAAREAPAAPRAAGTCRGTWDSATQSVRIESSAVTEVHLRARPSGASHGLEAQARSMYRNLLEELQAVGARPDDVVKEKVFLGDVGSQTEGLLEIRERAFGRAPERAERRPALTLVQQPPARRGQLCELQAFAMLPAEGFPLLSLPVAGLPPGCSGRTVVEPDGTEHVWLSGLTGATGGDEFEQQAAVMYLLGEHHLRGRHLTFHDVVRTWIYFADIDATYATLNTVRRRFYASRGVTPAPASTGIGGPPWPAGRACALDLVAVRGGRGAVETAPLRSSTMNEAPSYGSDFSRGTRVTKQDRTILHLSGTASIDTEGRVVAVGDVEGQVERMLVNVETLLAAQGASYAHLASAVTYVKRAQDLPAVHRAFRRRGVPERFPHTFCVADVCRPEWLCEMEAVAVVV